MMIPAKSMAKTIRIKPPPERLTVVATPQMRAAFRLTVQATLALIIVIARTSTATTSHHVSQSLNQSKPV